MGLETAAASGDDENLISFRVTDEMLKEMRRIEKLTGFDIPTQFNKAYTLLRIYHETIQQGGQMYIKTPSKEGEVIMPGYNSPRK